jgi:hypothetical protein
LNLQNSVNGAVNQQFTKKLKNNPSGLFFYACIFFMLLYTIFAVLDFNFDLPRVLTESVPDFGWQIPRG